MAAELESQGFAEPASPGANLFARLEITAIGVVAIVAVYLAATESLIWVPFVLGALIGLAALLIRWPDGAIMGLLVAGSVPRWFFPVSTWNAKPEHVVVGACGAVVLFRVASRIDQWKRLEKSDFLLLAFLAANYLSSCVYSPEPASTLRWSLLQTLAAAPFFLIGQLIRTKDYLNRVMRWWLWIGALEASFGIGCYFSHLLLGTSLGITLFHYIGFMPGVHGTLWEPNIFGSYCTCFAVMNLFCYLSDNRRNVWYMVGFALSTIGLLLSMARQAWVCLIIVGGGILLFRLRHNLRHRKAHRKTNQWKRLALALGGVAVAIAIGFFAVRDMMDRVSTLSLSEVAEDPTVVRRVGLIVLALQDIQKHPILGLGSSSFQLLYLGEDDSYQGVGEAWLGSLFFRVVHDTGIIGMFFFGWFMIDLGRRAWRVLWARGSTDVAVGALLSCAIVMVIAYQLTDASTLAFTWIHLGLLAAGIRIAEETWGVGSGVASGG
jgi:hypothetical protein